MLCAQGCENAHLGTTADQPVGGVGGTQSTVHFQCRVEPTGESGWLHCLSRPFALLPAGVVLLDCYAICLPLHEIGGGLHGVHAEIHAEGLIRRLVRSYCAAYCAVSLAERLRLISTTNVSAYLWPIALRFPIELNHFRVVR